MDCVSTAEEARPPALLSTAEDFFNAWPGQTSGYLTIWAKKPNAPGSQTYSFTGTERNHLAACKALELAEAGYDVYFGTCLLGFKPADSERGKASDVCAMPGLWLDIDVSTTGHAADNLCPDEASAIALLQQFPLQPTIINRSGGGLHVFWAFACPLKLSSEDHRARARGLSDRLQDFFRLPHVNPEGWRVDHTADLARVLRVLGTVNRKYTPARLVENILFAPDCRYTPQQILERLPEEAPPEPVKAPVRPVQDQGARPGAFERAHLYVASIPGEGSGNRNNRAFKLAADIQIGFNLGEAGWPIFLEWCSRCSPPLEKREAVACWRSGSKGAYVPGYLLNEDRDRPFVDAGPAPAASNGGPMGDTNGRATVDLSVELPASPTEGLFALKTAKLNPADIQGAIHSMEMPIYQLENTPPQTVIEDMLRLMRRASTFYFGPMGLSHFDPKDPHSRLIQALNPRSLCLRLGGIANFVTGSKRDKETDKIKIVPKSFPGPLAEQILELGQSELALDELRRVVPVPIFGADGKLITEHGVHNGVAVKPDIQIRPVSKRPSENELHEVYSILDELVCDFPFERQADKANAFALAASPFLREMYDLCPLIGIEAACPGTGKGLLGDLMMLPFLGPSFQGRAMIGELHGENAEKVLCAILLAAPVVVQLDNVVKLASGPLCLTLTTERPSFRILGENRMASPWNQAVWLSTANNPVYSDEVARRVVPIRLVASQERPAERTGFRHIDIKQWATDNRAKLVWAILTLIQNWVAQGMPKGGQTFGSFQRWADVLGGVLKCAGIEGFLEGRAEALSRSDVESEEWSSFYAAWYQKFGSGKVSSSDLSQVVRETTVPSHVFRCSTDQSQLSTLGRSLHARMHRVYGGLRLETAGASNGRKLYRLAVVEAELKTTDQDAVQQALEGF